ncbi:MAG: hypothetical protein GEU88_10265 [Solirubrobacterales bacterium]|nr:hypothetical protein [Solirubrobacterales bacterium]
MSPFERISELCLALPEVTREEAPPHAAFRVRGRVFAWYLEDHHGDGTVGVSCKVHPDQDQALLAAHPERYYRPAYTRRGWVGLRLDTPDISWAEVEELVTESFRLVAPKRLAAEIEEGRAIRALSDVRREGDQRRSSALTTTQRHLWALSCQDQRAYAGRARGIRSAAIHAWRRGRRLRRPGGNSNAGSVDSSAGALVDRGPGRVGGASAAGLGRRSTVRAALLDQRHGRHRDRRQHPAHLPGRRSAMRGGASGDGIRLGAQQQQLRHAARERRPGGARGRVQLLERGP